MDYVKNIDLCRCLSLLLVVCTQSVETSKTAFIAPTNTEYILECWGGGSNVSVYLGYIAPGVNGGYSKGKMVMSNNQTIYIVVGGGGASNNGLLGGNGGYNGGGNGGNSKKHAGGAGGGGATHIANKSCLLKDLNPNDFAKQLILVAGGAGGSALNGRSNGYGGGKNGGSTTTAGYPYDSGTIPLAGASQTEGYSFGQGQNAPEKTAGGSWGDEGCGGGGGGLYGGYAYLSSGGDGSCCAGSGGSGYVGNINIKDGITKQNVESPSGNYNGYASVSWILKE